MAHTMSSFRLGDFFVEKPCNSSTTRSRSRFLHDWTSITQLTRTSITQLTNWIVFSQIIRCLLYLINFQALISNDINISILVLFKKTYAISCIKRSKQTFQEPSLSPSTNQIPDHGAQDGSQYMFLLTTWCICWLKSLVTMTALYHILPRNVAESPYLYC